MNQETQEIEAVQAVEPVATADEKAVETTVSETAADDGVEKEKQEERRFTQAELDEAIQKRLKKEERRVHRRVEQQLREQAQRQTAAQAPKREAYRNDDEYLQAHIEHIAEQKAEELLSKREQLKQIDQRNETFQQKAEAVAERLPDFDQVVGNPNLRITEGMAEFLTDSDVGAELAYYLGKNPATAARIADMSPFKAARELTKIESELGKPKTVKASNAPEPINPVGTRGRSSTSSQPSDNDDLDTWMKKERARLAAR